MLITKPPRPPGRPKNLGKRAAIIEAARALFTTNAFESVTVDQVAKAAGVAKMTVYSHFNDKESLFEAFVQSISDRMAAALPTLPRTGSDMEAELIVFGRTFLGIVLSPAVVTSMNRNIDVLAQMPPLAERFYNAGPGRTRAMLTAFLTVLAGEDRLPADQADEAASDLMSLWIGDRPLQLALGLAAPIEPDEIARHVSRCTKLFLRAYGLSAPHP